MTLELNVISWSSYSSTRNVYLYIKDCESEIFTLYLRVYDHVKSNFIGTAFM